MHGILRSTAYWKFLNLNKPSESLNVKMAAVLLFILASMLSVEKAAARKEIIPLIKKHSSNNTDYLTPRELKGLLDKLNGCTTSMNNTASEALLQKSNNNTSHDCNPNHVCQSSEEIFNTLNISHGKFDSASLESACPIILNNLDSCLCNGTKVLMDVEQKRPTSFEVWGLGFLFVTVISVCSLLGVMFLPFMDKHFYKQLLMVLIGLAVGSLSASSIFHLIPQAFRLARDDSSHKYLNISLMLWCGIWVFFITERIMKIITNARHKHHVQSEHPFKDVSTEAVSVISSPTELLPSQEVEEHLREGCILPRPSTLYNYQGQMLRPSLADHELPHESHSHNHHIHFEQGRDSVIATVAWMIIFGDGLHNFIDGLSIGAAFNESILTGISISVAVMCEELPHELGDFAVLLNAGMTMRQALVYNFLSACTCYLGLILGILLGEFEASSYIFGFAAGMFMYISLVDMMPELNEAAEEASKVNVRTAIKTLTLQNVGMVTGVVALYILARFQDSINFI